ncbi:TRAP transporter small permease subunit [Roseobacter sinensis]|uniref:TRAP transporter small permease protein n=1 Tax=Roseobacter sinensis TaxID=2931391 RepID=A0ABT3BKI4_9RHOB|nr:TRAP transporter small permease [Roseobacter sp. WL0113]MCV3274076.1 TRAP transporter small permease [Roseobacter sp. WL0113]
MTWLIGKFAETAAYGFAVIVLMMVYEVVARYGFGAPTFWAHEIAGLLGAVAFLLGGAYCMIDGSHMRVTALTDRMPAGLKWMADGLALICGAVYLAALTFSGWQIAERSLFRFMPDGSWFPERSGSSWNTPLPAFVKFALFLGAVLFLAVVLQQLVAWLRQGRSSSEPDRAPR